MVLMYWIDQKKVIVTVQQHHPASELSAARRWRHPAPPNGAGQQTEEGPGKIWSTDEGGRDELLQNINRAVGRTPTRQEVFHSV